MAEIDMHILEKKNDMPHCKYILIFKSFGMFYIP